MDESTRDVELHAAPGGQRYIVISRKDSDYPWLFGERDVRDVGPIVETMIEWAAEAHGRLFPASFPSPQPGRKRGRGLALKRARDLLRAARNAVELVEACGWAPSDPGASLAVRSAVQTLGASARRAHDAFVAMTRLGDPRLAFAVAVLVRALRLGAPGLRAEIDTMRGAVIGLAPVHEREATRARLFPTLDAARHLDGARNGGK